MPPDPKPPNIAATAATAAASPPAGSGGGEGATAATVAPRIRRHRATTRPPPPLLPPSGLQSWQREGAPTVCHRLLPSRHLPLLHLHAIRRHHASPPAPAGFGGGEGAAIPPASAGPVPPSSPGCGST
uniref:Uncharacterized protein n=1 Tax=Oryza sativa subsp. japonica TaxID=39947 RepID=Q2QVZ9_ORYSJ|nr:hypothetical protein LOC_Os12g11070 [Oryza sativa Japonica Group]